MKLLHLKMMLFFWVALLGYGMATEDIEILELDIISYEKFIQNETLSLNQLNHALHEKGIVGIKGIPGYEEKVKAFVKQAMKFTKLPEKTKTAYAPNHDLGEMFLGYEAGKERFKLASGKWVIDDLKVSYYALVPDCKANKWPLELNLKTPFQELGLLMSEMGEAVMSKIGLAGHGTEIDLSDIPAVGRMLYYRKNQDSGQDNPYWCGTHYDHGLFTVLTPAFYFMEGKAIVEPLEAGLFVKTTYDGKFKKVVSNDPNVLLFQVGEFGQLISNDAIKATEHRVHKADQSVERYALALFFDAPMETMIHSTSVLTADERYGKSPCSYREWRERSFNRYIVKDDEI